MKARSARGVVEKGLAAQVQRVGLVAQVGHDEVEPAVAVDVAGVGAHAGLGHAVVVVAGAGEQAHFLEAAAAEVAV